VVGGGLRLTWRLFLCMARPDAGRSVRGGRCQAAAARCHGFEPSGRGSSSLLLGLASGRGGGWGRRSTFRPIRAPAGASLSRFRASRARPNGSGSCFLCSASTAERLGELFFVLREHGRTARGAVFCAPRARPNGSGSRFLCFRRVGAPQPRRFFVVGGVWCGSGGGLSVRGCAGADAGRRDRGGQR
jgi:hypothetical protein